MIDIVRLPEVNSIEVRDHDSSHHLYNAKNDGELHLERVGVRERVLGLTPCLKAQSATRHTKVRVLASRCSIGYLYRYGTPYSLDHSHNHSHNYNFEHSLDHKSQEQAESQ